MNEKEQKQREAFNRAVLMGHEERDASPKSLAWILGGFFFLLLVSFLLLWGLMIMFNWRNPPAQPEEAAQMGLRPFAQFPGPNLQIAPNKDLKEFVETGTNHLHSFGWVEPEKDVVHIPIGRAMEILLERGFPVRTEIRPEIDGLTPLQYQQRRALEGAQEKKAAK